MNLFTSLLICGVMATTIAGVKALKCHQCTTYEHTQCGDPFYFDDGNPRSEDKYLKDCPEDGKNYTLCRKMYQNVRGDERVVRSCGWEQSYSSDGEARDCYSTVLEEYNTYVCTCSGDGCNGSTTSTISMISIVLAFVLAAVFK